MTDDIRHDWCPLHGTWHVGSVDPVCPACTKEAKVLAMSARIATLEAENAELRREYDECLPKITKRC